MPKGSSSSCRSQPSCPTSLDVHHCSMEQLVHLLAEVLRLHLSSRHLITSRTKSVMAQRLYCTIHSIDEELSHVSTGPATLTTTLSPIATPPFLLQCPCQPTQTNRRPNPPRRRLGLSLLSHLRTLLLVFPLSPNCNRNLPQSEPINAASLST